MLEVKMSLFGFLVLLLVASICGSIGTAIAGYNTRGCLTSIVIGFIGAIIGRWLSRELGVHDLFYLAGVPIIWSIIGAAIFVAVINLISGGHRTKKRK